ncbi:hypothetical protein [Fulvivirga lutea]|uniref:Uncharacterized protein n=1 Tax=Fulvivirga lutea TaxID=2810512 RepID=A0A975A1B9_9BACT|nr:hypothetical protein [Fulvivirga lutea]QSE98080.1 hypothetical protein JR347_03085 [Fulvivirga lutea]
MTKRLLIAVLIVSVFTFIIYFYLGGYNKVDFELVNEDLTIYGAPYQGSIEGGELDSLISHFQQLSRTTNKEFTVVDYFLNSEDSIKQFIGLKSSSEINIPSIEMREVTMLRAKITAHPLVMPLPEDVKKAAENFASENEYRLDDFSIEIYSEKGELTVLFPVKAN